MNLATARRLQDQVESLLSFEEVAARLGTSRRVVELLSRRGKLHPVRLGARCVRFDPTDVEKYLRERDRN